MNQITEIDIKSNKKTTYKHSPISAQQNGFHGLHYANGKFYIFLVNSTGGYLSIVDEEDFFGPVVSQTKFYRNSSFWLQQILLYVLAIAIITTAFLVVKRKLKKLNKLQILDNGLKYRNKFREFKRFD